MDFNTVFFIALSVIVILYTFYLSNNKKRVHILAEIGFILIYVGIILIVLFPETLKFLEVIFGVKSGLNFILYLSIFVAYFIIYILYQKLEIQRNDTTKLVREIALLRNEKKK